MEYTFPDYKKGLVNVICSIEKYFKVPSKHNSLDLLDKILKENNSKNVVLFLFDGLGYNIYAIWTYMKGFEDGQHRLIQER